MLIELSKKDEYWRKTAFYICKDKSLADDLVNDMYLKLHNYNKQINDFFVIMVIRNSFYDLKKKEKNNRKFKYECDNIENLNIFDENFEPNDNQQDILEATKILKFWELELLDMSNEYSYRELEKRYNINYMTIYKTVQKSKKKIWQKINENKVQG